jgi:ribosomal protein L40E
MSRDETEKKGAPAAPAAPTAEDDDGRELDAQIALYLKLGLPAATLIGSIVAWVLRHDPAAVVLVLCAGALISVIALFWSSIRTLVGETPLSGADAYAIGAPRAEEEQKRAVLRALKDLEFERSVGKISEEDYKALVAKYRAEAKRLLRTLEEGAEPRRQKAADLVAERLYQEGLAEAPPDPYRGADPVAKAPTNKKKKGKSKPAVNVEAPAVKAEVPVAKVEAPAAEARVKEDNAAKPACFSCGTRNDADAAFCKKCGARLDPDEDESDEEPVAEPKEESAS